MKTITLKELACYLPFELQILRPNGKTKLLMSGLVGNLYVFNENGIETFGAIKANTNKPIVYPLSMLTQEIEHKGERFVPIERIGIYDPKNYLYLEEQVIYGLVESIVRDQLIEWHFWIFDQSYFEEGLVIDKSKIK